MRLKNGRLRICVPIIRMVVSRNSNPTQGPGYKIIVCNFNFIFISNINNTKINKDFSSADMVLLLF